jgi:hypothetical protein
MSDKASPIPLKPKLFFLALLIIMFFVYRYPFSIQKGPYSIHAWRQACDLTWTKNYLEEGFQFFKPSVHWTTINHRDQAAQQFPIINYSVALLWGIFGQHEFIFRLFNLLIVYLGLFYLFKLSYQFLADSFWSIYIPILLFTSPVLVYYANNFPPNAPAFGLALIGLYHYWKFVQTKRLKFLYISILIYLLAGLIKPTALLSFGAIIAIHVISQINYVRNILSIPRIGKLSHLLPMIGVFVVFYIWVLWVRNYNQEGITGLYTTGFRPVWDTENIYEVLYYGTQLYTFMYPAFFSHAALVIILTAFAWLIIKFQKTDRVLMSFTITIFIGILFYLLLFIKGFTVHDYYLINLLIFIPLTSIAFLHYMKSNQINLYYSKAFRGLAVVGLILVMYNTMVMQRVRYDLGDTFVKHTILLDDQQKSFWRGMHVEYKNRYEALETITPYLRELGIKRTDYVISVPDRTPNVSLYMMDQKGCSEYGLFDKEGNDRIGEYINTGTRYLIVNEPGYLNKPFLGKYIDKKIGEYKGVQIFTLLVPEETDAE